MAYSDAYEPEMNILTVVVTRLQFVKTAAVCRALRHARTEHPVVGSGRWQYARFLDGCALPGPLWQEG